MHLFTNHSFLRFVNLHRNWIYAFWPLYPLHKILRKLTYFDNSYMYYIRNCDTRHWRGATSLKIYLIPWAVQKAIFSVLITWKQTCESREVKCLILPSCWCSYWALWGIRGSGGALNHRGAAHSAVAGESCIGLEPPFCFLLRLEVGLVRGLNQRCKSVL